MRHWAEIAKKAGFTYTAEIETGSITLLPEIRKMCEMNTCGAYNKNWSCPPVCGTLEECRKRLLQYERGILLQTVGEVEDWMDYEGMLRVEEEHKQAFDRFVDLMKEEMEDLLPVGTGGCRRCKVCIYPEASCRYPDRCCTSMEAYGMEVSRICRENGLNYNYGPGKISYTACCFFY